MTNFPKYFAVPVNKTADWSDILDYAYDTYGVNGNDFCGSRTYFASTGAMVVKLVTFED